MLRGKPFFRKSKEEWAQGFIRFSNNLFARVTIAHLWARAMAQSRRWTASGGCCTTPGSMVRSMSGGRLSDDYYLGKINSSPGRLMLMDKVSWRNGWPVVGVPSDTPQPAPRVNNIKRKQSRSQIISRRPFTSDFTPSQQHHPRSSSKYFSFSSIVP